jgi:hypothetical protein
MAYSDRTYRGRLSCASRLHLVSVDVIVSVRQTNERSTSGASISFVQPSRSLFRCPKVSLISVSPFTSTPNRSTCSLPRESAEACKTRARNVRLEAGASDANSQEGSANNCQRLVLTALLDRVQTFCVRSENCLVRRGECPCCHQVVEREWTFSLGDCWGWKYREGDLLRWGGNDVGVPGAAYVHVACMPRSCPSCGGLDDTVYEVNVHHDVIIGVSPVVANARLDNGHLSGRA